MKKYLLIFISFFSKMTFASVGIADGPAIDYGFDSMWFIALFFVIPILIIELLFLIVLAFNKKKKTVFKILKINAIILPLIWLATIFIPKINKALSGDYIIYNQKQLEELSSLNLSKIKGHLLISGVNDLTSLSSLEEVSGNLLISFEEWDIYKKNETLTSLKGLNNLKSIGGKLIIKYTSLSNLNGLDNLSTIKNGIQIKYNSNLITLEGLLNLPPSFNHINISNNSNLQSLQGLENLKTIESLYLFENQSLSSLKGFDNLEKVNESLLIDRNSKLSTLNNLKKLNSINNSYLRITGSGLNSLVGLENLENIGGNLEITYNDKLTSLIGLESLKTIGDELIIGNNNILQTLKGLDNLDSIGRNLQIGYYKQSYKGSKEYDNGNKMLSDYCAIKNTKILGRTFIKYNLINPDIKELNFSENCKKNK